MGTKLIGIEFHKKTLLDAMNKASKKVISYSFVEWLTKKLHLPNTNLSSAITALVVSIFIWAFSWIIDRIVRIPITWLEAAYIAVPAIATGFLFLISKIAVDICFIANINFIMDFCKTEKAFAGMTNWFNKVFTTWPQIIFSVLIGALGTISLRALLINYTSIRSVFGIYMGTFFGMAIIGVATYLTLTIPTGVSLGAKYEMNIYPYDPAKSKIVQVTSNMFGQLTLLVSIACTAVMILLFFLNPWGNTTKWIALTWLVYIWGLASYTFILPNYFLRKAIIFSKYLVLQELDLIINGYQSRIKKLNKNEWASFKEVISLREKVSATRNSPIELKGWTQYFSSIIIPALSYISGILDLKTIINKFFT